MRAVVSVLLAALVIANCGGSNVHAAEDAALGSGDLSLAIHGFTSVHSRSPAGTTSSASGANLLAAFRVLAGQRMPSTDGGSWLGVFVEPAAGIHFFEVKQVAPREGFSFGGPALQASLSLGVQYMRFPPSPSKRSGIGFALGGAAGSSLVLSEASPPSPGFYGIVGSLVFPRYDSVQREFSAIQINAGVLLIYETISVTGGVQYSF